jgi:hypothetical protein
METGKSDIFVIGRQFVAGLAEREPHPTRGGYFYGRVGLLPLFASNKQPGLTRLQGTP